METTLRVYDADGARLGVLPWSTLTRSIVRNGAGALTVSSPRSEIKAGLLDDGQRYLRVAENGVEAPDWYVLDDDGDNDADDAGAARPVTIGASGAAQILDWGTVYSWEYEHGVTTSLLGLDPYYGFAAATPGHMLRTFIDAAQARGCFPQLTYSFTSTHDSAGQPWPHEYARTFDVGTTVLKVLTGMSDDAWVDWEMVGFRLDVYLPDTVLAEDRDDVILRLGQSVRSGPRKRTRKGARSVILANGAEGAMIEVADAEAVAKWGRREGYEGRNGITDVGTLTAATEVSLRRATSASESITLELAPAALPSLSLPRPGGYIRYDQRRLSATELEPMRVQSIAWEYGDDPKVSVELADLWVDRDVRLARRVDAILNGSSANERVPQPERGDERPPSTPEGLALVSAAYEDPTTGQLYAQATASWLEVMTDEGGGPVQELLGYTVEWFQPDVLPNTAQFPAKRVEAGAGDTKASWSPLVPGTPVRARIAAYDRFHNYSPWSNWVEIMAGVDETPPPTPSAPLVDNYLGLLRVRWDGAFAAGAARPADLHRIEVHVSSVSGFAPDPRPIAEGGTLAGTLIAAGSVFQDAPYRATRYAKLVGVDTTGNRSTASAQGQGATGQVVEADVFDGAIGSAKLADLAVTTAKINDLAVNSAKVGSIEVGKLIAGTMTADVIMGGKIATGARGLGTPVVELNSLGIFRWNAADQVTVQIDNNGALLTGTYKTAASGRRIEIGAGGTTGRVNFYSPSGKLGFINSWTEATGVEAIQIGMLPDSWGSTDHNTLWNRLNINTSPNGDYTTLRSGTLEFVYDSTAPNEEGRFVVYQTSNRGAGDAIQRFFISPSGEAGFTFAANQGSQLVRAGHGSQSPMTRYFTGGGYGNLIKVYHDSRGVWHEFRSWDDANWTGIRAANFEVNSDARNKREVADANLSAVALVKRARVKRYIRDHTDRATEIDERGAPTSRVKPGSERRNAREEIGLLAQEAPPQIVLGDAGTGMGIDLYQMASLLWAAVQELDGRLAPLERKPA